MMTNEENNKGKLLKGKMLSIFNKLLKRKEAESLFGCKRAKDIKQFYCSACNRYYTEDEYRQHLGSRLIMDTDIDRDIESQKAKIDMGSETDNQNIQLFKPQSFNGEKYGLTPLGKEQTREITGFVPEAYVASILGLEKNEHIDRIMYDNVNKITDNMAEESE